MFGEFPIVGWHDVRMAEIGDAADAGPFFGDDVDFAHAGRAFVVDLLDFESEVGEEVCQIPADFRVRERTGRLEANEFGNQIDGLNHRCSLSERRIANRTANRTTEPSMFYFWSN